MKRTGALAAVAISSALSLGASMAPAPASGDPAANIGRTIDHNPLAAPTRATALGAPKNRSTPIPATTSKR